MGFYTGSQRRAPWRGHSVRRGVCLGGLLLLATCGPRPETTAPKASPASPELSYDAMAQAAQSYFDGGQLERAGEVAQDAAERDPSRPEAHLLLARVHFMKRDMSTALGHYQRARATGLATREFLLELAGAYDLADQLTESLQIYAELMERHPRDTEIIQEAGLTELRAGHGARAVELLRQASDTRPNDLQLKQDLGYALFATGSLPEAATLFSQIIAADPERHHALQFLAQIRATQGDSAEALRLLNEAVIKGRTDPEPVRLRAQLRLRMGDDAGALGDYELLLRAKPADAAAMIGAAGALIRLGRLDDAQARVDAARRAVGDAPPVQFRHGQIAWRRGDKAGVDVIRAYAEAHPTTLEAWEELLAAAVATHDKPLQKLAKKHIDALR